MPRRAAVLTLIALAAFAALAGCTGSRPAVGTPTPPAASDGDARLAWWRRARLGIFIHWGVYAVPAGRWEGHEVPGPGEWIMHNAKIPVGDYEPLAGAFNPTRFDADAWCRVFADSGAGYVVTTSKHHDGFAMFDSRVSSWDIADATPFRRDPIHELDAACARAGLRFGAYHSIMDWHDPDARGDAFAKYEQYMRTQLREIAADAPHLALLWFDGEWIDEWTEQRGAALETYCRELVPGVVINNRIGKARDGMAGLSAYRGAGDYDTPEQQVPGSRPDGDWETCMTMNDTWGFKTDDHNWKSSARLIRTLSETAGKGGNLLLNVGPKADGTLPDESVSLLAAIGRWMRVNDEAIRGTDAGPFTRTPWGACTASPRTLYIHVHDWPDDNTIELTGLRARVRSARVLGSDAGVRASATDRGVVLRVADSVRPDPAVTVIRLDLADGPPRVETIPLRPDASGAFTLRAADAELRGRGVRLESKGGQRNIGFWTGEHDEARWDIEAPAGDYRVELDSAVAPAPDSAPQPFECTVGDARLRAMTAPTTGWGDFRAAALGTIRLPAAGRYTASIRPIPPMSKPLMNMRSIRLVPIVAPAKE